MAGLTHVFFDTSVLLAGIIDLGPASTAPQRLLDAVARGRFTRPLTAWHCCLEFYSVSTRLPGALRLRPEQAQLLVEEEVMGRFHVHALPQDRRTRLFRDAVTEGVAGGRIYDAHIAEIARLAGARIVLTENRRHFVSLLRHGVRVESAAAFVEEAHL